MNFTLTMNMDNAAFTENSSPEVEAARILHDLAGHVADRCLVPGASFDLRDFNGNKIGKAEVTE